MSSWGDRATIKELRENKTMLEGIIQGVIYSILSRIHDDGADESLYNVELEMLRGALDVSDR